MTDRQTIRRRTGGAAAVLTGGALTALLAGCGGGGGSLGGSIQPPVGGAAAKGMQVTMHDTPAAYQKLNITIAKVTAVDSGSNEVSLTDTPQTFDVLALQNGAVRSLAIKADLPAGTYTQVRLYLTAADVVDNAGNDNTVAVGVAPNNYIKVGGAFTVSDTALTTVALDFDAANSLVSGLGYQLKPVVRLDTPAAATGSVTGTITNMVMLTGTGTGIGIGMGPGGIGMGPGGIGMGPGGIGTGPGLPVPTPMPLTGATVRAYPAGQSTDPTVPAVGMAASGQTGVYAISGLPAGQYDLLITSPAGGSHTITGVTVTAGGSVTSGYGFNAN